jgi:ElaB/YqjD/DUF883 family membrane-anchored ribosome-binding protein
MSNINETLKQKIDELDLDRRLNELVDRGEEIFHVAVAKAGEFVHEHREDIDRRVDRTLDTLSDGLEERSSGQWAERVDQVRDRLEVGLDRLAERRAEDDPQAP